ncbi:hypothetical protein AWC23_18360 [Mycobacterium saskatchewanense]|uniref:Universal stress protein n=1 Tax=Mycobacterium saskatchewanense TaxID=220927 RepID=A0AAJ3NNE6_9MYCO|nr:universal stress protein [Mycobacterium saskatchewanense]ORW70145.1 hypothetical protein AWC23_18360 [Mycobacterium saskatchewanense]
MSTHPRGVVVVVNGPLSSPAAVEWGAREASLRDVTLTLVAIRKPGMRRDVATAALVAAADAIEGQCSSRIDLEIVDGLVIWVLLGLSNCSELLILGAGFQRQAADSLLRSAPARLVEHARCPVLVVHDLDRWRPNLPVLVAVESCPSCEVAIDLGFQEASRRGVDLITVHNASGPAERASFPAEDAVAESLATHRARYPDVPVLSLPRRASDEGRWGGYSRSAQLVVICDRAAQEFSGLRLGPLTCAVLRYVRAPVLVARRARVHTQ